jgi:hypothetical protein
MKEATGYAPPRCGSAGTVSVEGILQMAPFDA